VKRKKTHGAESLAIAVSESVPFLLYDLHRQLAVKLRLKGFNAAFALKVDISVGDSVFMGLAQATGVFVPAICAPEPLQFKNDKGLPLYHNLRSISVKNSKRFEDCGITLYPDIHARAASEENQEEKLKKLLNKSRTDPVLTEKLTEVENANPEITASKNLYVVEVDDMLDENLLGQLVGTDYSTTIPICSTTTLPGIEPSLLSNVQFVTQIVVRKWEGLSKKSEFS